MPATLLRCDPGARDASFHCSICHPVCLPQVCQTGLRLFGDTFLAHRIFVTSTDLRVDQLKKGQEQGRHCCTLGTHQGCVWPVTLQTSCY